MKLFPRKPRFMFKEYTDETIRFDITKQNDTKILGTKIGKHILNSFKNNHPIKGVYIFGRIGMGKTVLSTAIINSFENTDDLLIDVKHKIQYRYYDTYPGCYHLDYYSFLRSDFQWKEKIQLNDNEMIIAEWSDYLPKRPISYFEDDKIEIELYPCFDKKTICTQRGVEKLNFTTITADGSMRFATFIGYGNGIDLIKKLKIDKDLEPIIVDPNEL